MTTPDLGAPSLGFLVWHLSLRWQVQLSRALAPLGITHTDYGVLASLHGLSRSGAEPSQRQLADASGLEPMYVSKLVRGLEHSGLIERNRNPADPRAFRLSLTGQGADIVTAARRVVVELEEQRLAALGGSSGPRAAQLKDALVDLLRQAGETTGTPATAPARPEKPRKESIDDPTTHTWTDPHRRAGRTSP